MIKVNLGCGEFYAPGWVNLDLYHDGARRPDQVWDVSVSLPFKFGSVDRLYAGHLLEHVEYEHVVAMLDMWHDYAAKSAQLLVVGPDSDRGREWYQAGQMSEEHLCGMGELRGQEQGLGHLWTATATNTIELLQRSRWRGIEELQVALVSNEWPLTSRVGWQFAVRCVA